MTMLVIWLPSIIPLVVSAGVHALSPEDEAKIDAFMEDVLACTEVPGMNLAAVYQGDVVLAKGYGVANLDTQEPVTNKTIFSIGSITKGMAGVLNAIMFNKSDEGVGWDTPVRDIIGDWFYLNTGYLSNHTTTRDVLAHKMGFPPHDFPGFMDVFTRKEYLERFRFMEAYTEFRSDYWYNNNMFTVASEVAEALGGGPEWEELLRREILDPLGMRDTTFLSMAAPELEGFATAYTTNSYNEYVPLPGTVFGGSKAQSAAGDVASTAEDMAQYLNLLVGAGPETIDYAVAKEAFTPEYGLDSTPLFQRPKDQETAHLRYAYARGFDIGHYKGVKTVGHGGSWMGYNSYLYTEPDTMAGVYTSANAWINNAQYMITLYVSDVIKGEEPWFTAEDACRKNYREREQKRMEKEAKKTSQTETFFRSSMPLSSYAGQFGNFLYGNVSVRLDESGNLELSYGSIGLYELVQIWGSTFRSQGKNAASEVIEIGTVEYYAYDDDTNSYNELTVSEFEWWDPPVFVRGLKLEDAPPPSLDTC